MCMLDCWCGFIHMLYMTVDISLCSHWQFFGFHSGLYSILYMSAVLWLSKFVDSSCLNSGFRILWFLLAVKIGRLIWDYVMIYIANCSKACFCFFVFLQKTWQSKYWIHFLDSRIHLDVNILNAILISKDE